MTASDLVQLATFGSQPRGIRPADVDVPSPDGRLHAVVVKRGNLSDNTVRFSLLLFRTDRLFDHPRPDTLITLASSSNRPAIESLRWLRDNRTLLFLGERPGERPQIYALDIQTRTLTRRTGQATEIMHFDVAPGGDPIVYTAKPAVDTAGYATMRARGFAVRSGQFVGDVLGGVWADAGSEWSTHGLAQTFIWRAGAPSPIMARLPGPLYRTCDGNTISIAPTGRLALIQCTRAKAPAAWHGYTDAYIAKLLDLGATLPEFALLDLERGTVAPLVDAPVVYASARWAPTGRSVVLSEAFLPLHGVNAAERRWRAAHAGIAEVDVASGRVRVIARRDSLNVVAWDSASNTVEFAPSPSAMSPPDGSRVRYRKTVRGWREVKISPQASAPLLRVQEGLNEPPELVAVDRANQRRATVFDPNPQLESIRLGRVQLFRWTTKSGDARFGGLYYPPDFVKGRRYPLVIQTHGFDSTAWAPDGIYPTADAAQPMAGHDILVLQLGGGSDGTWVHVADIASPTEGPRAMDEIESAIEHLDSLGLVDRQRIGLIGFSRTCYHVLYTLTHSRYSFAAAAISDGIDFGYFQYLAYRNAQLGAGFTIDEFGGVNGGPPWGKSLYAWLARAPGFNLDRVSAPLRLEAIGVGSVLEEWEPFAGLLLQGKPVELFVIPAGEHVLVKPWDRLASSGGNTDWFRFWLKGEEDPDTAKAVQYARWRALRNVQTDHVRSDSVTRGLSR